MTYEEFRVMLLNTLRTETTVVVPNAPQQYSDQSLYEATLGAHHAILPWVQKGTTYNIVGDGVNDQFTLPSDYYTIEAVQDVSSGLFMQRATIQPGITRNASSNQNASGYDWIVFPNKKIYFSKILSTNQIARIYYNAYWSTPVDADDTEFVMDPPTASLFGMMYWAASHCLIPYTIAESQVDRYKMKIDSGVPTDNALEVVVRMMRQLFTEEMNRLTRPIGIAK